MSQETPKPLNQLTPKEFGGALGIRIDPAGIEFIITRVKGIAFAVSLKSGMAYTRPQLIEIFGRRGDSTYVVTRTHES
jgi:hypothetical protein